MKDQRYEIVDIDSIQPHEDNPNHGDVDLIAESIRTNDFYGAVVVQTSTRRILAGEHRWRAARQEGKTEIPVIFRDCDDRTAIRILLADNETARGSYIDEGAVAALLDEIGDVEGTGYRLDWLAEQEKNREEQEREKEQTDTGRVPRGRPRDFEGRHVVIIDFATQAEQEQAYERLSELYDPENLRVLSV